jgi:hypothetical protein
VQRYSDRQHFKTNSCETANHLRSTRILRQDTVPCSHVSIPRYIEAIGVAIRATRKALCCAVTGALIVIPLVEGRGEKKEERGE